MLTPLLLNDLVSIAQRPYPTHVSTWRMGICTGHSRGQPSRRVWRSVWTVVGSAVSPGVDPGVSDFMTNGDVVSSNRE